MESNHKLPTPTHRGGGGEPITMVQGGGGLGHIYVPGPDGPHPPPPWDGVHPPAPPVGVGWGGGCVRKSIAFIEIALKIN